MVLINYLQDIEKILNEIMPWMYWKGEVFAFYIAFFLFLALLAIISLKKSSNLRAGILKIPLTLGDRVFISIALFILTMLAMNALNLPLQVTLIISSLIALLIYWRG